MNSFKLSLMLIVFCLLNACIPTSKQTDVMDKDTRVCVARCQVEMKQCQARCDNNCVTCEKEAVRLTKKDFHRYLKERCVEGKSFIRRLQSYHDPLQCRKTTCDCPADLRVCVESCQGSIHKQIQVETSCC